jgi:hypothetical protein
MTSKDTAKSEKRQRGKPFKKGESGNPAGRPQGSRNKASLAIEALLDGQGEALTQKAIDLALDGDSAALRLCLERLCPPRKSRPINIALPETKTAEGVSEAQATVVQAVAGGELTPDEGSIMTSILEARRKSIETQDHEIRIAVLEAERGKRGRS